MTANVWRGRILSALCTLLLLAIASCTGSNSTPDDNQLPGTGPSIFGLSKSSVNAGETLGILGSNFGLVQGAGTVTLNGVPLTVNAWGDNEIDVTVPGGTSSGVIIVTQNGTASESGQEAQIFIGTQPSFTPVIVSISPDAARAGQEDISIVGTGFGQPGATSQVLFQDGVGGTVAGTIVNNPATSNPQWTATNIRVLVPAGARSGNVVVTTPNGPSNGFPIDVLPPQIDLSQTKITDVSPVGGPVGTVLTITGNNFGQFQGNNRAFIQSNGNDRELIIAPGDWTNSVITATIPLGATTGTLHVIVNGKDVAFGTNVVVAEQPLITGVTPSDLRIGKALTILGKHFGSDAGTVQIGSTTLTAAQVTTWSDNEIDIATLPGVTLPNSKYNHLDVVVTSHAGLPSAGFTVQLVSDLRGTVTVNPKTGIAGASTGTEFTFTVNAAGNDDSVFAYTLYPDASDTSIKVESQPSGGQPASPQLKYKYPTGGKTYKTQVKIEDTTSGDFIILSEPASPSIFVGAPADVVIVDFGPRDFAKGALDANGQPVYKGENDNTFLSVPTLSYNDFVFTPQFDAPEDMWFTTGVDDVTESGNSTSWTRNQGDFLYGTSKSRPYGYRRNSGGGRVRVHGYNFGATTGEIWLNSTVAGAPGIQVSQIDAWNVKADGVTAAGANEDGYIDFRLPLDQKSIGGKFTIKNITSGFTGTSVDPLVVSPFLPASVPATSASLGMAATTTTNILGYDLVAPPPIAGITGSQTRIFWIVWATYTDPFTGNPTPSAKRVLCENPFPVTITNGNTIVFDMAQFGGKANIEAYDATGQQFKEVKDATLYAAPTGSLYSFFVWSGVLPNNGTVSGTLLANSGVMSEQRDVNITP